jgi:hypothetical protein
MQPHPLGCCLNEVTGLPHHDECAWLVLEVKCAALCRIQNLQEKAAHGGHVLIEAPCPAWNHHLAIDFCLLCLCLKGRLCREGRE